MPADSFVSPLTLTACGGHRAGCPAGGGANINAQTEETALLGPTSSWAAQHPELNTCWLQEHESEGDRTPLMKVKKDQCLVIICIRLLCCIRKFCHTVARKEIH
ncbi:hypothetical protein J4Q44_G00225470 [Coregonus suidteri]|uniref:Uncharacterized protein n=1 Tax=Coregonus suidteri TaxID=861788 RepID=A0AAN8QIS6_9TELE